MSGTPTPAPDAALDTYLDGSAALVGLDLPAGSRAAVRENLALLFSLARQFTAAPLPPSVDPAPVFRP